MSNPPTKEYIELESTLIRSFETFVHTYADDEIRLKSGHLFKVYRPAHGAPRLELRLLRADESSENVCAIYVESTPEHIQRRIFRALHFFG